jgi:hypothetical protein
MFPDIYSPEERFAIKGLRRCASRKTIHASGITGR